ncbi:MAG: [acyl-carrier-protein] S-malonyltransferase [Deltaproteobacteria bacterium]|nr:MAG: [acyl-carrier-protein] S-malonyltransferase [Deltaproteobacteria bacterium]
MNIAVLFPGQGSQYLGMGREFMASDPDLQAMMDIAGEVCGLPLTDICLNGTMEELTRSVHLQPAVTAVNIICYEALKKSLPQGVKAVAGHSLGEYSALHAAGVIDFAQTIKLVAKRGALMEREGNKNPGGMRAVMGLEISKVEEMIKAYQGPGVITAANHNYQQQVVVSGSFAALDAVCSSLKEQGAAIVPLKISAANHSPLVAGAIPDFAEFMQEMDFQPPKTDVFFNVTAQTEQNPAKIKEVMADQISSRVRWYELINNMLAGGIDVFIEAGPKNVLNGLLRKIIPKGAEVKRLQFDTPEGLAKCMQTLF